MSEFDREILRQFEQSLIPREGFDDTKYHYCAEYTGVSGSYIWKAKTLGYEIIRGDMPENPGIRDEKGECRLADVVFMRMPKDRFNQIEKAMEAKNRETQGKLSDEQIKEDINEKMSRLLGHSVNMSFSFTRPEELARRRG